MSKQRAAVREVRTTAEAQALAELLCSPSRRAPVVVISIASDASAPYVDAELVAEALIGFADVYVIATRAVSWAFSRVMPPRTRVYGGASRVYPADDVWQDEPLRSPLRFAWRPDTSGEVADELIKDALGMAVAGGGFRVVSAGADTVRVTGRVTRVTGGRAFVHLEDDSLATIWPELVVPGTTGLAPESIVSIGMTVTGALDRSSRRIDVSELLQPAKVALAAYAVGDQVLVRVTEVERDLARVEVFPRVPANISAQHLAGTKDADARDYVSVGDVLVVRVRERGGLGVNWRFTALDTDLDEPIRDAPAILRDGPPWLTRPAVAQPDDVPTEAEATVEEDGGLGTARGGAEPSGPVSRHPTGHAPAINRIVPKPAPPPGARVAPRPTTAPTSGAPPTPGPPPTPAPPRIPTPLDMLPRPTPPAQTPAAATPPAGTTPAPSTASAPGVDAPTARGETSAVGLADGSDQSAELLRERDQLAAELQRVTAQLDSAQLKRSRIQDRLRHETTLRERYARRIAELEERAGRAAADESLFEDPAEQLDFEVRLQWARRIPKGDKAARPLSPYRIGPDFFPSWTAVDGVERSKVVDVLVEVLTGLDREVSGRALHQLRRGQGGNDPFVVRDDGATCWRVSLQVNTAQARRLHYWRLPDGSVELASVRLHDDTRP